MEQYLEKKDLRLIAVCLAVALVSLLVGVPLFYQVFPEASIDFRVTREQARDQAAAFLTARGWDLGGYRHSAVFLHDETAKTFLERELGLQGATALIGRPVRLWQWSNRWVRELQKEEFHVQITTTGELVGFAHLVEEGREGARLGQPEARALAERFVAEILHRSLDSLVFVEGQTVERPHRIDHSFTWKLRDFEVRDATYRLRVGIQGGEVASFDEFLKVPEAWERDYQELRSRNEATGKVAMVLLVLTLVAMLAVFSRSVRRQDVRWKSALVFGGIAAILMLLAQLNDLPVAVHGYDTTNSFGSFLTRYLLGSLLAALGQGLLIAFLTAAAEPMYRRTYGQQIQLSQQFLPHGLRTKRFFLGTVIGLTMTAFFFAYQTLFYLVAERFGAWSPAEIPYSEMVNTYFPWVMVLLIGFMPAVSEEFICRAFSIPFLEKLLKSRWAALAAAAFIWGFGHAGYPQQPFFVRGLEVGLAGIGIGLVMLRWGLLPVLTWHYTVDALYTALILLRSSNPYFVVSAAVSAGLMLLPLLVVLALYLRHRFFVDPTSALNQADSPPPLPPPSRLRNEPSPELQLLENIPDSPLSICRPMSHRHRGIAAGVVVAGLLLLLVKVEKPVDFADIAVDRAQAGRLATDHLGSLGVDLEGYRTAVFQNIAFDSETAKYLLERQGMPGLNRLYRQDLQASLWRVRFFQPLRKEEYQVDVDPADGSIRAVRHLLDEDAPGADLDESQARRLAAGHLQAYRLNPAALELKESSSEKRKARRDYRFVWETPADDPRSVDEARYRCEVEVAGQEPVSLRRWLKLPESWLRHREESGVLRALLRGLEVALVVGVGLHLLWLLIRQLRSGSIDWKPLLRLGGLGSAVTGLNLLNSLPTFYQTYPTQLTLGVFLVSQLVGWLLILILVGLLLVAGLALAITLYPDCLERLRASSRQRDYVQDALFATGLVLLASLEFRHLIAWLREVFAPHLVGIEPKLVSGLDTFWPFLGGVSYSLAAGLSLPVAAGIGLFYLRRVLRHPLGIGLAILGIGLVSAGAVSVDAGEFLLGLSLFLLQAGFALAVVVCLLRNNLLAYVLTGFLDSAFTGSFALITQSAPSCQVHGWIWLLLSLAGVAALWRRTRGQAPRVAGSA